MRHTRLVILILILLRFWLGVRLSIAVPAWEAYDEPGHFAYAVELATGKLSSEPNPERIQPPLYYVLIGFSLRLSGSNLNAFTFPERNPYFYYGGGVNYALHRMLRTTQNVETERELRFSRILSLQLTLPAVALAYLVGRRWRSPLLITAFAALWPQGLFNASMVTNDGLTITLGAALIYLLVLSMSKRNSAVYLAIVLIGAFIKLNLLLMVLPFLIAHWCRRSSLRHLLLIGVIAVIAIGMLSLIPGVLLPFIQTDGGLTGAAERIWQNVADDGVQLLTESFAYLLFSSIGLFGWGNVPLPQWVQIVSIALIVSGLFGWMLRRDADHADRPSRWLLVSILAAPILGGLALVTYYHSIHLMTGRYMLPALPVLCIILVSGWGRQVSLLLVIGVCLLDVLLPSYIGSFYTRPPAVATGNRVNMPMLSGTVLVDYHVETEFPEVYVRLCWRATRTIGEDYRIRVEVIGSDRQGYGLTESIPGGGNHPTTNWIADETFCDDYQLLIRSDAPNGFGYIRVTMLTITSQVSIELEDAVVSFPQ